MKIIIKFLDDNVIGKFMYTDELYYYLEDKKLQGIYSDQIVFSNLRYNDFSLNFDMFVVTNEKIYELNDKGEKTKLRKNFSGVGLFRYELAKRLSTDEITGSMRFISGTLKNAPAEAIVNSVYNLRFSNNQLSWAEQQILYRDQPSENDENQSVAFDSENKIFLENNKLNFEYNGKCFDVDSKTLNKKESKSVFPKFISKEK